MPKLKTRKIAAKRFKITKTGKVVHRTKGARHLRRKKSKARQRRQDSPKVLTNTKFIRKIKQEIVV
ncbi:MAG: 50S ribosomal protein L35 [Patescibacteria group bacterium]|nr:50S ribosomal protein L35 [Patescibacteria group bacterium]